MLPSHRAHSWGLREGEGRVLVNHTGVDCLSFITADTFRSEHISSKIVRNNLKRLTASLIQRPFDACKKALIDAWVKVPGANDVIHVGGESAHPHKAIIIAIAEQSSASAGNAADAVLLGNIPL